MSFTKAATARVSLAALRHNIATIKSKSPNPNIKIMAISKANGYGHGAVEISKAVSSQVNGFGVARIEEAIELRMGGIGHDKTVLLLEGFYSAKDVPTLLSYNLDTAVHCKEQLEALETKSSGLGTRKIKVWLKIDTGMHRLGVRPEEVDEFCARLNACENVAKPINMMSHFGCADDDIQNPQFTLDQIQLFTNLTAKYQCSDTNKGTSQRVCGERSLAASSGCLAWPTSHFDWIRPGISMYGVSPFGHRTADELGLRPAMTLSSSLIAVRKVTAGESVGYGATWTAPSETRIGVVAIGYADGYPRIASMGTPVLVNGRRVPLVGRVSMDMITVDLGIDTTDKVGDEVVLWGEGLPADEVAVHSQTIGYELVARLPARVKVEYH